MPKIPKDLIAASSFPLVLSVLAAGESYGYEIIRSIGERSRGKLVFAEGTLYPVLKKMESERWISSRWHIADNGRERKYYKLTAAGKKQLKAEKENWVSVNEILQNLWPTYLTLKSI